jgi:hypothetical protein
LNSNCYLRLLSYDEEKIMRVQLIHIIYTQMVKKKKKVPHTMPAIETIGATLSAKPALVAAAAAAAAAAAEIGFIVGCKRYHIITQD